MRTLSVMFDEETPPRSVALIRMVLASIPAHFCLTEGPHADVVVVSGARHSWPASLGRQVRNGVPITIVMSPGAADCEEVRHVADQATRAGALVGIDVGFAHARFWTSALPRVRKDLASSALLDSVISSSHVTDTPLVTAFVEQMAVVRSVVGALDAVRLNHRLVDRYMVTARAGGVLVNLTGLVSARAEASLSIDLVGWSSRWRVRFGDDELARPGDISRFNADGADSQAPIFESPHRAMWLSLHAAAVDGSRLPHTLDDLADELTLAEQLGLFPTDA